MNTRSTTYVVVSYLSGTHGRNTNYNRGGWSEHQNIREAISTARLINGRLFEVTYDHNTAHEQHVKLAVYKGGKRTWPKWPR